MGPTPVDNLQFAKAFGPQDGTGGPGGDPHGGLPDPDHLGEQNLNPPGMGLWQLWREDLRTHGGDVLAQGFWALAVHRFGNWRMGVRWRVLRWPLSVLYKFLEKWVQWTCGISLAYTVKVGRRVRIWHFGGMVLGARSIGNDVHIRQNTTFGVARRGDNRGLKPVIEDRCDIGAGVVIAGPITVGHDSVIGANAVVLKDVPPRSVAVGIPAKVIRTLSEAEVGDGAAAHPLPADKVAAAPTPWDAAGGPPPAGNGEPSAPASANPPPAAPPVSPERQQLLSKARDVEF